jgi:SAM-dependent methyltransferase
MRRILALQDDVSAEQPPPQPAPASRAAHELTRWERAYHAFETPEEEVCKFLRRLQSFGVDNWDKRWRIVEVCSGRGNGLRAWHVLGFHRILGVDLSGALVSRYSGPGQCVVGDARALPLPSGSRDVAVVQGGLHHLFSIEDVDLALHEMRRVVVPGGRIIIVEPWRTPFLRFVHAVSNRRVVRRLSRKLDALATMTEEELETYERWLRAPYALLKLVRQHLVLEVERRRWGKLMVLGRPRAS